MLKAYCILFNFKSAWGNISLMVDIYSKNTGFFITPIIATWKFSWTQRSAWRSSFSWFTSCVSLWMGSFGDNTSLKLDYCNTYITWAASEDYSEITVDSKCGSLLADRWNLPYQDNTFAAVAILALSRCLIAMPLNFWMAQGPVTCRTIFSEQNLSILCA